MIYYYVEYVKGIKIRAFESLTTKGMLLNLAKVTLDKSKPKLYSVSVEKDTLKVFGKIVPTSGKYKCDTCKYKISVNDHDSFICLCIYKQCVMYKKENCDNYHNLIVVTSQAKKPIEENRRKPTAKLL